MGPAYLIDVVGLDIAYHAGQVMAGAFPNRMALGGTTALELLFKLNRFGQKNGKGFYQYSEDKKGKPVKSIDDTVPALINDAVKGSQHFDDETIIERLMLPMCFEVVRCLAEGIVNDAVDADMGLIMGVGFPLFRGGAVRYMENLGLNTLIQQAEHYQHLGELYQVPELLREKAQKGQSFFSQEELIA